MKGLDLTVEEVVAAANAYIVNTYKVKHGLPSLPGLCNNLDCTKDEFKNWGSENYREYKLIVQLVEEIVIESVASGRINNEQGKFLLNHDFGYGEKKKEIESVDNLSDEERADIELVLKSNLLG